MKRVLIINLKRLGDVYTTSYLTSSIQKNYPNCEVSLLVYEESKQAAKNLKGISQVYTINRKEIITIKANRIFNDSLALEKLHHETTPIKAISWDSIINFSNDSVSSFLTSYFDINEGGSKIGISFNADRTVHTYSDWDIVYNDVLTSSALSPLHFTDVQHRMCAQPLRSEGEKIKLNPRHNESAYRNIQQLRKHLGGEDNVNVIALQLSSSCEEKAPLTQTYIDLIKLLTRTTHLVPILVIAPTEEERLKAREINHVFNNKLVVAEADLTALASVLTNVDYLITPDTVTKHIADLCDTACLEISLGEAPLFKQGTRNLNSQILTVDLDKRLFSNQIPNVQNAPFKDQREMIQARDIFQCLNSHFTGGQATLNLSPGLSLYRPFIDSMGVNYRVISGETSALLNGQRNIARYFLANLFDLPKDFTLVKMIAEELYPLGSTHIDQQKESLGKLTRDLLATLRALIQYQEDPRKGSTFVQGLERLLDNAYDFSLSSIVTQVFRGRVDSLNLNSAQNNVKAMESLLYEMKTDVQTALSSLKDIEEKMSEMKKASLISKFEERDSKPGSITFI